MRTWKVRQIRRERIWTVAKRLARAARRRGGAPGMGRTILAPQPVKYFGIGEAVFTSQPDFVVDQPTHRGDHVSLDNMVVFSGNANPALAELVVRHLGLPLGKAVIGRFSDGEIQTEIMEHVRGKDVFIIQ